MSGSFWRERRVIVTGGAGFLGSHVMEGLTRRGCTATLAPRKAEYDLREPAAIRAMLGAFPADMIIHLAAVVGGIGANRRHPGRFFSDNLVMGVELIEAARLHGVRKVATVGTICAYPKMTAVPFREEDLWSGYPEETNAPYGIAKKALLVMGQAYRQEYGLDAIYLLPVNLYGPRDDFDPASSHVIPALIRKMVEARRAGAASVEVWGDGTPSREFLHARDAARAIALALESYDDPEPVNLGTGHEITIAALAEKIKHFTEFRGELRWNPEQPNGQPRRCLDTSRARERFGFEAEIGLDDGLLETVRWWEEHGVR
jgi:GDP-L-fucose synthase